jgi:hypothetical protein
MQRANKALLTGDGAAVLAAAATVSRERKQAVAKPDTPMLPELIDKWAAEKQPKARSVDMWRRTCAMFYAVNGEKPVGAIAKADVLAFKTHLIAEGKAPATVDSRLNHLRSLFRFAVENDIIATDPAASVKAPPAKRAKEARLPYDADALKAVFGSASRCVGSPPEADVSLCRRVSNQARPSRCDVPLCERVSICPGPALTGFEADGAPAEK